MRCLDTVTNVVLFQLLCDFPRRDSDRSDNTDELIALGQVSRYV